MKTKEVKIWPKHARELLAADEEARKGDKQSRHRDISGFKISDIASDITTDNWHRTHQGMLIADNNEIFDGRHRLYACIQADKPITVQLTNGVPVEEARVMMRYIDGARPRSVGTQLWLAEGTENSRHVVPAIRAQWSLAFGSSKETGGTTSAFIDCYNAQAETLQQIILILTGGSSRKIASSLIGPIAYYAYSHPKEAAQFATSYVTGERLGTTSPILWLKRTFESHATKRQRHRVYDRSLMTANALLSFHEGYRCSVIFRASDPGREWLTKASHGLTSVLLKHAPKYVHKQDRKIPMGETKQKEEITQ